MPSHDPEKPPQPQPSSSDKAPKSSSDDQAASDFDAEGTQLAEAFAKALNEGVLKNHPTS